MRLDVRRSTARAHCSSRSWPRIRCLLNSQSDEWRSSLFRPRTGHLSHQPAYGCSEVYEEWHGNSHAKTLTDLDETTWLFLGSDSQSFHLPVQMTALKAQHFGRTADVSVILVKLLQNVVALVRRACLVQRGELISNGAPTAIAVYQRRQVLTLKAAGRRIHNDDALDHVAEFAHISRPGVAHKGFNSVITELARPAAIGGRGFP